MKSAVIVECSCVMIDELIIPIGQQPANHHVMMSVDDSFFVLPPRCSTAANKLATATQTMPPDRLGRLRGSK